MTKPVEIKDLLENEPLDQRVLPRTVCLSEMYYNEKVRSKRQMAFVITEVTRSYVFTVDGGVYECVTHQHHE